MATHQSTRHKAYVTCLLFKGTGKVHVLDRKDFAGGVVADIEDSLRFIERNTRLAYRIEKLSDFTLRHSDVFLRQPIMASPSDAALPTSP